MCRIASIFVASVVVALSPGCQKGTSESPDETAQTDTTNTQPAGSEASGSEAAGDGKGGAAQRTPSKPSLPIVPPPSDVTAPPEDAQRTASGLAYKFLDKSGSEERPVAADTVVVHYTGWTTNGYMFDTSKKRGKPARFPLTRVIAGWTEGLQLLAKGDKARLWIPEELAYKGQAGKPQGMLVFDVELVDIIAAPKPPPDVAAPPADATKTKSGLAYKILQPGEGKNPRAWDEVEVHYSGWTTDGKMFDSSVMRGNPTSFGLDKVIPGWTEGLQLMKPGAKARLWIPEELAYKGKPGAPQGMLVFDVELLSVTVKPDPPPVPKDVAAPPKNAKKTDKGVFYRVLTPGTGKERPTENSKVTVHYSGWTTDGKMFDSSVTRGQPISFHLKRVIPGWTDGLQTMVVGQKSRFWIPEELAYQGKPGAPQGMLVFDVELISFE
ncbi:FKBP-type peptidyl-prolyl cis-trans isomerase [Haliangium sp.]|uniref:FKBP-type peptidyl-prolyl cis-trans isomerase n=1 Tax=Haliangium sp. TaxID=2663208 RepID=UPI003D0AEAA4